MAYKIYSMLHYFIIDQLYWEADKPVFSSAPSLTHAVFFFKLYKFKYDKFYTPLQNGVIYNYLKLHKIVIIK